MKDNEKEDKEDIVFGISSFLISRLAFIKLKSILKMN
jgi:hypothetical protein